MGKLPPHSFAWLRYADMSCEQPIPVSWALATQMAQLDHTAALRC